MIILLHRLAARWLATCIVLPALFPVGVLSACIARSQQLFFIEQPSGIQDGTLIQIDSDDAPDRGNIPIGGQAQRHVTIKNIGQTDVSLSIVSKSCNCVHTSIESLALAPGASTQLVMTIVVTGGVGRQTHSVRLQAVAVPNESSTSHKARQQLDAGIAFTPDREYDVYPRWVVMHAIVGYSATASVSVVSRSGRDLEVRNADTGIQSLRVTGPKHDPKNRSVQLLTLATAPVQSGTTQTYMAFDTNSETLPHTQVDVTVVALSPWRCESGGLIVRYEGDAGKNVVSSKLTKRTDSAPLPVHITLDPPMSGITVALEGQQLKATVDAAQVRGTSGSTIAHVRSEEGAVCVDVPVVWYSMKTRR